MRRICSLVFLCAISQFSGICATPPIAFKPGCALAPDFEPREIDRVCPAMGKPSMPGLAEQNVAKNNFCASGLPTVLTITDFIQLQRVVEMLNIPFGTTSKLPEDRSFIQMSKKLYVSSGGNTVSEGSLVRVAGYILSAKSSDAQTGQSSYCKLTGIDANALVIRLVNDRSQNVCSSIAVEMSPHYRPASWTLEVLAAVQQHSLKVRATGQLFFNASHEPCGPSGAQRPNPVAFGASVWEVLPVYSFDVCTMSGNDCSPSSEKGWVSLRNWQSKR